MIYLIKILVVFLECLICLLEEHLSRMSIFALNIMPYISASIIIQLMSSTSSHLAQLKKMAKAVGKKLLNIQDMEQFFWLAFKHWE